MLRLHRSGVSAPHAKRMSLSSFHNVHRIEQVVTLPNACFPVAGFAFTAMRAHSASSSRNWERKPVNFTDTSIFREHSSTELLRGLAVFRLCRMRQLVLWSVPLLTKIELILGEHLTYNTLVKCTFFKHFCAGTDEIEIRPSLAKLRRVGIGPILDYAAEADSVEDAPKESGKTASTLEVDMYKVLHRANIQYRADGALYDETCEKFIKCIVHASQNKLPSGLAFAAVKVTGLCDPQLLVRVTALLLYVRRIWLRLFYGNEEAIEKKQRLQDARVREKTNLPLEHFIREILHIVPTMSVDEAKAVGKRFDTMNKGNVEFVDFTFIMGNMLVGSNPKPDPVLDPFIKNMPRLSDRERELMIETRRRADALAQKATELGVRVMFDAEQTFYQKAIDHLVRELQRKYNQTEPVVYNTYQAYMKITDERVRNDLQRAERQNWVWGGKLVRGAYLEQEAALAQRFRYENPVCSSKKATDTSYDLCVERILKYINVHPGTKLGVLFGTHNLSSLQLATQRITEIQHTHRKEYEVSFAQLYGMGDHLTFPIAKAGFSAFKYVPYGKVKETVYYLYRRALENSAMLSSPTNENNFIIEELKGRAFFWKKRDGIKRE